MCGFFGCGLGVRLMAEGQLRGLVIGIILFTLVMGASVTFLANLNEFKPGITTGSRFRDWNNTLPTSLEAEGLTTTVERQANATGDEDDSPGQGFFDILFKGGITSFKAVKDGSVFIKDSLAGLTVLKVPGWVVALLAALITVFVSFAILGAVFNRNL